MNDYLAITAVFMLVLGLIWRKDWWLNILIKLSLMGLGIWGLVLFLISLGYIIHK